MEYLSSVTGKKGKEYIYEIVYSGGGENGRPVLAGLISTEELKAKLGGTRREPGGPQSQLGGYLEAGSRIEENGTMSF
jgi:hypothetical protein